MAFVPDQNADCVDLDQLKLVLTMVGSATAIGRPAGSGRGGLMPNDRNGNPIVTGDVYALAGTVRAVDGDSVVVVVGDRGEQAIRVKAGDMVPVAHAARGPFAPLDGSQAFTAAPSSAVAASLPQHLVRIAEVNALFNALTATYLGYLANKSDVGHTHSADAASVSDGDWSGALVGSGVKNVQDLADWIDANVTGGRLDR